MRCFEETELVVSNMSDLAENEQKQNIKAFKIKTSAKKNGNKTYVIQWCADYKTLADGKGAFAPGKYFEKQRERIAKHLRVCDDHCSWMMKAKKSQGIDGKCNYTLDAAVALDEISMQYCKPLDGDQIILLIGNESCDTPRCKIQIYSDRLKRRRKKKTSKNKNKKEVDADSDIEFVDEYVDESTDSDEYEAKKENKTKKNGYKRDPKQWGQLLDAVTSKYQHRLSPMGLCELTNLSFTENKIFNRIPKHIEDRYGLPPPVSQPTHLLIQSKNVDSGQDFTTSNYLYRSTKVRKDENGSIIAEAVERHYTFKTDKRMPKLGVLLVGIGGNNGTTVLGGILANKHNIAWNNKDGVQYANYFGSLSQSSTTLLGCNEENEQVYVPLKSLVPMVDPNDLIINGWDINNFSLDAAMQRAAVFEYELQQKLKPYLKDITPMKSIYYPDFIAANQCSRANNIYHGEVACLKHLNLIRNDIVSFKSRNTLDKVIVIWTANTERFSDVVAGVHDTEENFLNSIANAQSGEISPSQMFATASILEDCAFINGSPQNTFCPALIEMARKRNVFIGGNDFKSGQTKLKSVLVDFLISSGIKPESIVSYNHLGNNDGKNLNAAKQFQSKEISKSNVVDDIIKSNKILYKKNKDEIDHCVVIKYVPNVGDSKRAMDEYISRIFMNGKNTIVLHNTCEDSLLAAPIIIDLIIFTELFQRITWKLTSESDHDYKPFDCMLTMLSFFLKAPLVPKNTPIINALFKQRSCIENILRATVGLPPINNMLLEHKTNPKKNKWEVHHCIL